MIGRRLDILLGVSPVGFRDLALYHADPVSGCTDSARVATRHNNVGAVASSARQVCDVLLASTHTPCVHADVLERLTAVLAARHARIA